MTTRPVRHQRFVAYGDRCPAEHLFITINRVAKDGTWADITVQTWALQWTKRQKLDERGYPPDSEPYDWDWKDLFVQERDHLDVDIAGWDFLSSLRDGT